MARRPVTNIELRELADMLRKGAEYHRRSGMLLSKHMKRCGVEGQSAHDIEMLAVRMETRGLEAHTLPPEPERPRPELAPPPAAAPTVAPCVEAKQQLDAYLLEKRDYFGFKRHSGNFANRRVTLLERIPEVRG